MIIFIFDIDIIFKKQFHILKKTNLIWMSSLVQNSSVFGFHGVNFYFRKKNLICSLKKQKIHILNIKQMDFSKTFGPLVKYDWQKKKIYLKQGQKDDYSTVPIFL